MGKATSKIKFSSHADLVRSRETDTGFSARVISATGTLDHIADAVYANACDKGFHPKSETRHQFIEQMSNNLHDEVSELHEAHRNGHLDDPCDKAEGMVELGLQPLTCLEEELADIVIRALDNARHLKVDIARAVDVKHAFNKTRPFRHGGKQS